MLAPAQPRGGRGGGGRVRRPTGGPAPPRPGLAATAAGPPPPAARRPGLGPRHHQRPEPASAGRRAAWRPPPSTTGSTPTPRPATGIGSAGPSAWPTGPACCSSPPGRWPGRTWRRVWRWPPPSGGTYWLLGPAEDGYGPELDRLVEGAACPVLLGADGGRPGGGTGRVAWRSTMPTPPAMSSCCRRPGKASGTRRSSRPPTAGPWPSGRTRWPPSWPPSASAGSTARYPAPCRPGSMTPTPTWCAHNHRIAARHFNLADLPDAPRRLLLGPLS